MHTPGNHEEEATPVSRILFYATISLLHLPDHQHAAHPLRPIWLAPSEVVVIRPLQAVSASLSSGVLTFLQVGCPRPAMARNGPSYAKRPGGTLVTPGPCMLASWALRSQEQRDSRGGDPG